MDPLAIHVIDSITATTADTYYFDDAMFLLRCSEVQNLYVIIIHKS